MELTSAHLRYLLAIYEVSQTHLDISSRSIAEKLGVTKPSVVRVLNLLMERGMIVKEYYGKIYLTDRGIFVAREVKKQLDEVLAHFPPVEEALTDEERFTAALALTAALPERVFISHPPGSGIFLPHGQPAAYCARSARFSPQGHHFSFSSDIRFPVPSSTEIKMFSKRTLKAFLIHLMFRASSPCFSSFNFSCFSL